VLSKKGVGGDEDHHRGPTKERLTGERVTGIMGGGVFVAVLGCGGGGVCCWEWGEGGGNRAKRGSAISKRERAADQGGGKTIKKSSRN